VHPFHLSDLPLYPTPPRERIAAAYRAAEPDVLAALIVEARLSESAAAEVRVAADALARGVRESRASAGGVNALMLEFSLDSREGVALMCLAEALLRVPDAPTRDRLIRDKIGQGDWHAHVGRSPSLFVNAAAWGLLATGKLVDTRAESALEQAVASMLRKGGEPLVRKGVDLAMRLLGRQFVTGRTIAEALANAEEREARGYRYSFDMLGEGAVTDADALTYLAAYEEAIHAIGRHAQRLGVINGPGISVKLSALHPRFCRAQQARVRAELGPRLVALARLARHYDVGLNIDAEEADRLEISLDLMEVLARDPGLQGWHGIGFAVQAYQKRARSVIDWLIALGRDTRHRFMVRLVKGAYWDTEIKRAQVDGMADYPVFTRKAHTDVSYLACARAMLAAPEAIYPQFATHNAHTAAAIRTLAGTAAFEFQCLHGMGETLFDQIIGDPGWGRACRIYAPVGSHETLLAYLVRRLLENGANSSFVNRIVDPAVSIESLIADPVAAVVAGGGSANSQLRVPSALYPDRANSAGLDFSSEVELSALQAELAAAPRTFSAAPMLAIATDQARGTAARGLATAIRPDGTATVLRNPADREDVVGTVVSATVGEVLSAVSEAASAGAAWSRVPAAERASCLERAADLLEGDRATLMALAVREAGKSLPNALGEVREAADFCRYHAAQARRELGDDGVVPIGPVVCITPWNFPLAIFVGEISAALAAGNPVLAKPAEQTPLMAAAVVRLFRQSGVPDAALQLLPGAGEIVGQALVSDRRIKGVLFTGSTSVARSINRQLARRNDDGDETVLIAETGGQNAMIVDSSALPEQVVADAIVSAFDSAGQRCSALRVLCVQDDIADRVFTMIEGAMRELSIGDPRKLATDVGPVIDGAAQEVLVAHVERMRAAGMRVIQAQLPPECASGTFVPPTVIEIDGIARLEGEVFGPVLHVLRFGREHLPALVEALNSTGYGLTHGIQSRIDETVDAIVAQVRAGNIYVNRNIIGAVVGVQPFGGAGLSGTGPKAGGPLYLRRLVRPFASSPAASAFARLAPPMRRQLADLIAGAESITSVERSQLMTLLSALPEAQDAALTLDLPGPTGESNRWSLHPRGRVGCIADSDSTLAEQIIVIIGTGNRALVPDSAFGKRAASLLGAARCEASADVWSALPEAIVVAGDDDFVRACRERAASSNGAIVPVIGRLAAGGYEMARLLVERVVTINTTAAGGNAELLAMAG
jgi:RHH-type proline utilization regulon transcriptional repressor/proline dehydrogenase/delta 1-pyrroline-5-carboxylate dehydrogenase